MSRNTNSQEQSSLDAILKGLASRPNVQSTLILSRKDGSIIRSTGVSNNNNNSSLVSRSYDLSTASTLNNASPSSPTQQSKPDELSEANTKQVSPAQRLAISIHQFVTISSRLAVEVSQTHDSSGDTAYDATLQTQQQTLESRIADDDDVQLLRMRTKKQEIIIFPDPNYLCCVVQSIAKTSGRDEPT